MTVVTMKRVGPDLSQATPMVAADPACSGSDLSHTRTLGSTSVAGSAASKSTAAPVASEPVPLSCTLKQPLPPQGASRRRASTAATPPRYLRTSSAPLAPPPKSRQLTPPRQQCRGERVG